MLAGRDFHFYRHLRRGFTLNGGNLVKKTPTLLVKTESECYAQDLLAVCCDKTDS